MKLTRSTLPYPSLSLLWLAAVALTILLVRPALTGNVSHVNAGTAQASGSKTRPLAVPVPTPPAASEPGVPASTPSPSAPAIQITPQPIPAPIAPASATPRPAPGARMVEPHGTLKPGSVTWQRLIAAALASLLLIAGTSLRGGPRLHCLHPGNAR